jgi:hypothetical protein
MKQDADFFGERDVALIYIAKKLRDALRLEGLLTEAGIDYAVEPDKYKGGVIFAAERIGAFFYVLPEAVELARAVMERHRFRMIGDSGSRGGPPPSAPPS